MLPAPRRVVEDGSCPAGGVVLLQGQNAFDDMETADADERIGPTSCQPAPEVADPADRGRRRGLSRGRQGGPVAHGPAASGVATGLAFPAAGVNRGPGVERQSG